MLKNEIASMDKDTGVTSTVTGYYHDEYYGMYSPDNRIMFVNVLKNDWRQFPADAITECEARLAAAVKEDIAMITRTHGPMTLVGVPRSKAEASYHREQTGLKRALRRVVSENPLLSDGLDYIVRRIDTLCTHRGYRGNGGAGEGPRPGLIADTCLLSAEIAGKDVLLVDDIYTPGCGIDEDAIAAVLKMGAKSVVFYAIGYTVSRGRNFSRVA